MTPKEKAQDLVDKYQSGYVKEGHSYSFNNDLQDSKQMALIAVEQILFYQPFDVYTVEQSNRVNDYWQEVKKEIENL